MAFALFRKGIVVDPGRNTVAQQWGVLSWLLFLRKDALDDYRAVRIVKHYNKESSSQITYSVNLVACSGEPRIKKFGSVSMESPGGLSDIEIEKSKNYEQIRWIGKKLTVPDRPQVMKTEISQEGSGYLFVVPKMGNLWMFFPLFVLIIILIVCSIITGMSYLPLLIDAQSGESPSSMRELVMVLFFYGIPGTGTLLLALSLAWRHETVFVSPSELCWRKREGIWRKARRIPAEELEELNISTLKTMTEGPEGISLAGQISAIAGRVIFAGFITARSDDVSIEFGEGLAKDEMAYLYALALKTLAG